MPTLEQASLFDNTDAPAIDEAPAGTHHSATALKISTSNTVAFSTKLSAAQRRFNDLLQQIDTYSQELTELEALELRHQARCQQALQPLAIEINASRKKLLLALHARVVSKGLTSAQSRLTRDLARELLDEIVHADSDPDLKCLFEFYYPPLDTAELAELQAEEAHIKAELLEQLEAQFGREAVAGLDVSLSAQDLLDAAYARIDAQEQLHQAKQRERRAAKAEAKKATKVHTNNAQASKAQTNVSAAQPTTSAAPDPQTLLKTIYRQLASSLHPDREPDAQKRVEKTALMSQVNTAYAEKDLGSLLRVQLRIAQIDTDYVSRLADEQLKAMSALLKERHDALRLSCHDLRQRIAAVFQLQPHKPVNEKGLLANLAAQTAELQQALSSTQYDMYQVGDDGHFKIWLAVMREKRKDAQRSAREHEKLMRKVVNTMNTGRW